MNRKAALTLAAILALGVVPAYGAPVPAGVYDSIQTLVKEKKYADAVAAAEKALADADLAANDKLRLLRAAADASLRLGKPGIEAAIAYHERAIADTSLPVDARIESINNLANVQVQAESGKDLVRMDLSAAHATLQRALALPDLKPESRALALRNIARLYDRQDNFAESRKVYQQILALDVRPQVKNDAHRGIADTLAGEGKVDEAVAMLKANDLDVIPLYQKLGKSKELQDACVAVLNDTKQPENVRWNAFGKLPCWDFRSGSLSGVRAACDQYLASFLEKDPGRVTILLRPYKSQAAEKDHAFVEWAAPLLLSAPKLSDADYNIVKLAQIDALAALGKTEAALGAATAVAGDPRITPVNQYWAKLVIGLFKSGDGASLTSAVADAGDLKGKDKVDTLLRAARTALRAGNETGARTLYGVYEKLLNRPARAKIVSAFVADAPKDVGSWLTSPLLKNADGHAKLDRPYGENLEFLLATDAAVTGRNVEANASDNAGDQQTDFYTACDAEGLHLFFNTFDTRAAEVVAGLTGGGSYEMYLAPGKNQAYLTFLADLPKGNINVSDAGFITMYPNPQYRSPSIEEGTLRTSTLPTGKGFATHLFLSWELFYDKLPTDGTAWQFDSIRWTRAGGLSFGGSESVHNRNGWGDIVFANLSADNVTAIKRGIIYKAVARYRKAKHATGPVGHWADPILGDAAFYQAKVEPMIKKLDAYALQVNKDLTPAQVDTLFKEAVPGWMEGQHIVAAMRAEYLQDAMLGAAQK